MRFDAVETFDTEQKAVSTGKDELNFAEFPFGLLSESVPKGLRTLVFKDEIFDKSKKRLVKRTLTIEGSENFGLPTAKEDEVILALIQLTKKRGFVSRTVEYTRFELLSLLGWPNTGQSYRRLELALRRLVGVTMHYQNAWWDRSEERWTSGAFHIIDEFEINDSREQTKQLLLLPSRIKWSERVFKSFLDGNLRNIRYDVYVMLKHPTSKRMYRFLDKRFHQSSEWDFDLHDFAYEHIGLSRNYTDCGKIKEKLSSGFAELETIGFLEPMTRTERYTKASKGRWRVHVRQRKNRTSKKSEALELLPSPPPSKAAEALTRHGVEPFVSAELVRQRGEAFVTTQIAYLEFEMAKNPAKILDPAAWLVSAIRSPAGHAKPKGFISAEERERKEQERQVRQKAETEARQKKREQADRQHAEREAIATHWNSLSPAQQEEIQAAVDAEADAEFSVENVPSLELREELKKLGKGLRLQEHIKRILQLNGTLTPADA